MKLAILQKDKKYFRNNPINDLPVNKEMDDLWLITILEKVPPSMEDYLLLVHPKTEYSIIFELDYNWRRNLNENIKRAFIREFETLKENGIKPGSYEDYLDEFEFIKATPNLSEGIELLERRKTNFSEYFFISDTPIPFYVPRLELENLNHLFTTGEKIPPGPKPRNLLKELFNKYQNVNPEREFSFKENETALAIPEFIRKTNLSPEEFDTKKIIIIDNTNLYVKEPPEFHKKEVEKLGEDLDKLLKSGLKERDRKRFEKLYYLIVRALNEHISYNQVPFSGEYKNLKEPETLPDKPVFEFLLRLDNGVFLVERRVAVPADMEFTDFDKLFLHLFRWGGFPYHLSEFIFPPIDDPESKEAAEVLIWQEEDLPVQDYLKPADFNYLDLYDPFYKASKQDIKCKKLKDYFPKHRTAQYRYDFGDNWYHSIELVGIYDQEDYGKELPYLIESIGVAPQDDSGGIQGFIDVHDLHYKDYDFSRFFRIASEWTLERNFVLRAPTTLAPLFDNKFND